ncbi:BA14K family protein [Ciceribacter sp. L1K22]|uniref:BA14K family protein n=1 Tax=Ciceribacter sp. L1K22 TaxID=2820275 RepID=UPI001ABDBB1F|nr:BA14K family protein [Ciceribacter sp. L1K22]MBO3759109.1 BA14K family protein [Ciceribacter sp. L1K22]
MKISIKNLAAMGLAAAMAATSYLPAQAAMPLPAPVLQKSTDVTQVQYRRHYNRHGNGYYRGYRGYRHHRHGYRYHNGYWFPLAAFTTGAIIGGAIAQPAPPRAAGVNPRHYQWCANRYRSYDARSNTFQPYNGPRQQCYSPYY